MIMNLISKVSDKTLTKVRNFSITGFIMSLPMTVALAAGQVNPDEIVGKTVGTIGRIGLYVGIILLAWGIFQLVMAFKNEDADSKSRAILVIVAAALLCAMDTILNAVCSAAGIGYVSGGFFTG
jgi:hypothetical protein